MILLQRPVPRPTPMQQEFTLWGQQQRALHHSRLQAAAVGTDRHKARQAVRTTPASHGTLLTPLQPQLCQAQAKPGGDFGLAFQALLHKFGQKGSAAQPYGARVLVDNVFYQPPGQAQPQPEVGSAAADHADKQGAQAWSLPAEPGGCTCWRQLIQAKRCSPPLHAYVPCRAALQAPIPYLP